MREVGRPTVMTPEVKEAILERIICGESLVSICNDEDMPARRTVYKYLNEEGEDRDEFRARYERAVVLRTINMAEEIIAIGDDNSRDWVISQNDKGETVEAFDRDHVTRSKLMCENRWKFLEKLNPTRYGRSMHLTGEGAQGNMTIIHNHFGHLPDEEPVPKIAPSAERAIGKVEKEESEDDI